MGEAFIIRRGGKTASYAVIGVAFPSGSTITCTKGGVSLKANGSGTNVYFNVPEAGDWVVTIVDGAKTKSQTVTISAAGQVEKLSMAYGLVLISGGVVQTPGSWTNTNVTVTPGNGYTDFLCTSQDYSAGAYAISIDLTDYSTLTVDAYNVGDTNCDYLKIAIKSDSSATQPTTASEYIDIKTRSSRPSTPLTLDVSGKTGTWYVGIYGHGLFYSDLDIHRANARVYNMSLS
jgi:hypothetical protein